MLNPASFILPVWQIIQITFVKRQMPKQHCPGKSCAFRNEKCQDRLICPSIRHGDNGNHPAQAQVTADVLFTFFHDKIPFLICVNTKSSLCIVCSFFDVVQMKTAGIHLQDTSGTHYFVETDTKFLVK